MTDPNIVPSSKENNELLPCPFCGDSQLGTMRMSSFDETPPRQWLRIKCDTCGAMAPDSAWNKRAAVETTAVEPSFAGLKLVTVVDGSVPPDTIEFRASDGRVLGRIRQLAIASVKATCEHEWKDVTNIETVKYGTPLQSCTKCHAERVGSPPCVWRDGCKDVERCSAAGCCCGLQSQATAESEPEQRE